MLFTLRIVVYAYKQHFPGRFSIDMVKTAVDAVYELKAQLSPSGEVSDPDTKVNQFALHVSPTDPAGANDH